MPERGPQVPQGRELLGVVLPLVALHAALTTVSLPSIVGPAGPTVHLLACDLALEGQGPGPPGAGLHEADRQNGGGSWKSPLQPRVCPLDRAAFSGLAVAQRRLGPTSSAWTSIVERFSPSGVSHACMRS
jgi:hypothetical protein